MKFAQQCADSGGDVCPYCGSKNVDRWEKSRNYWGIYCEEKDCPSEGEGIIIHEKKVVKVVGIESGSDYWERKK